MKVQHRGLLPALLMGTGIGDATQGAGNLQSTLSIQLFPSELRSGSDLGGLQCMMTAPEGEGKWLIKWRQVSP